MEWWAICAKPRQEIPFYIWLGGCHTLPQLPFFNLNTNNHSTRVEFSNIGNFQGLIIYKKPTGVIKQEVWHFTNINHNMTTWRGGKKLLASGILACAASCHTRQQASNHKMCHLVTVPTNGWMVSIFLFLTLCVIGIYHYALFHDALI